MLSNFTGMVAPDLAENEKNGPVTGADDIKVMSLIGNYGKVSRVNQIEGIK
jgi:hypothetical protein